MEDRPCAEETIKRVLNDETLLEAILDLCERFDAEILPDGPAT